MPLSPDTREEIARAQRGDRDAMARLLEAHLPLIRTLAGRLSPEKGMRDELSQAGSIGLMQAVTHFLPEKGVSLSTYAVAWILGEMKRAMRCALDETGAMEKRRELLRCGATLEKRLGRPARIEELAGACGMDTHQAMLLEACAASPLSLDDEEKALAHTLQGDAGIDVERVSLRMSLQALAPQEQRVVFLRYFRDRTQQETAALLGRSQAQISRIEQRALDRLRELLA